MKKITVYVSIVTTAKILTFPSNWDTCQIRVTKPVTKVTVTVDNVEVCVMVEDVNQRLVRFGKLPCLRDTIVYNVLILPRSLEQLRNLSWLQFSVEKTITTSFLTRMVSHDEKSDTMLAVTIYVQP